MANGDSTVSSEATPQPTSFPAVDNQSAVPANKNIEFVLDIPLHVTVQIGSTRMLIRELLQLGAGIGDRTEQARGRTDGSAGQQQVGRSGRSGSGE